MRLSLSVFFSFFLLLNSYGKDNLKVNGRVINSQSKSPLIGCSVYNVTKQKGTITNEDGLFTIYVERGDIIQFTYIGMIPVERTIIEETEEEIEMKYLVKKIRDIVILNDNKLKNSVLYNKNYERNRRNIFIEPRRRTAQEMMSQAITPNMSPTGGVSFSPFTLLYYAFSKKEQRKLKAVIDIQNMDMSNQKYSLDFISMITSIDDEDELKDIKAHCYFPHELVLSSSYYELGIMLKECYVSYLLAKKEREEFKNKMESHK